MKAVAGLPFSDFKGKSEFVIVEAGKLFSTRNGNILSVNQDSEFQFKGTGDAFCFFGYQPYRFILSTRSWLDYQGIPVCYGPVCG